MKNLKRVLSLGLASVMLLGMMVVGASAADFTDSADIEHSEAVDVLVALGVVNGMEDGSYFDPKGDVTRAQMAKMIAVIKMGGTSVNTGVKTTPTFTDIKGHWAESEIEYCADMGIISGRGDGTFDPDGKVTTTEVTKMVLTTLGYDATAYGLTGAGWAAQTDELARGANPRLYEDLSNDVIGNLPATRDTAAQLLWNGLQNNTRSFDPETSKSTGEVTWGYNDSGKTLIEERFDAKVATGKFIGNDKFGDTGAGEGEIAIELDADSKEKFNDSDFKNIPSDLSIDNIGENVKVIWKDGSNGTKNAPDDKDTIFAVFNTGTTKVVRGKLADVGDNKNAKAQINLGGTKYDLNEQEDSDGYAVYVNYNFGAKETGYKAEKLKGSEKNVKENTDAKNSDLTGALKVTSGDLFKATFNDNGKIDTIYVTETYVAAVNAVNSTSVALNNHFGTVKFEDNDVEDGLKKGDVVLVTPLYKDDDKFFTVVKAETVSGEIDAFKDNESVTVDGTKYSTNYKGKGNTKNGANSKKEAYGLLGDIPELDDGAEVITAFNEDGKDYIGEDVTLYLANGYVVAAVQTSESSSNYSVILEVKDGTAGSLFSGMQLQVMGADGTKEVITVSEDSDDNDGKAGITAGDYQVGDIITYTFNDDDEADVTLKGKATDKESVKYNDKTKSVNEIPTTSDCVLFVQAKENKEPDENKMVIADGDYDVYDIRSLDGFDVKTGTWCTVAYDKPKDENNRKVVAVFVNLGEDPKGAESNTVYGIVSAYDGKVDKNYYKYTVQSNGEKYSILCDTHGSKDEGTLDKGVLVSFKRTADDKYKAKDITVYNSKSTDIVRVYVDEYSARDNTLSVFFDKEGKYGDWTGKNQKVYAMADDVKIIYVDADGSKSESEGSINSFSTIDGYYNAAIIFDEDRGETVVDVLFVETSGETNIFSDIKE